MTLMRSYRKRSLLFWLEIDYTLFLGDVRKEKKLQAPENLYVPLANQK